VRRDDRVHPRYLRVSSSRSETRDELENFPREKEIETTRQDDPFNERLKHHYRLLRSIRERQQRETMRGTKKKRNSAGRSAGKLSVSGSLYERNFSWILQRGSFIPVCVRAFTRARLQQISAPVTRNNDPIGSELLESPNLPNPPSLPTPNLHSYGSGFRAATVNLLATSRRLSGRVFPVAG